MYSLVATQKVREQRAVIATLQSSLDTSTEEIAALKKEREAIINTIDKRNLVVVNEDDANLWYSGVSTQDDWPEGFHCEDPISAELDRMRAEDGAADVLIARQRDLLTGVANALKGPPEELSTHSHHDLPEIAATLQANLAAARAELARAKPALIKAWEIFFTRSFSQDPIGRAEARYAREISQAHRGEEG